MEGGCTLRLETITVDRLADLDDPVLLADLHDFFMIVYLLLNLPWMILSAELSPSSKVRLRRFVLLSW